MASTVFSLEVARKCLHEDGFFDLEDSTAEELVWQLEQKGFPFISNFGLSWCKQRVIDDVRIRAILTETLGKCTLAHWLRYTASPPGLMCFRKGGQDAGRRSMLVHFWAKGSQADYYSGSHLHDMPKKKGLRRLWQNEPSALAAVGCVATPKDFKHGGLVVLDSRVDYEVKAGYVITLAFVADGFVKGWDKLRVPTELAQKVASLESDVIKVNYEVPTSSSEAP